jgi:poly(A) polymerase
LTNQASMDKQIQDLLRKTLIFLTERQVKGYIVGGFIRDALIGRTSPDIDIISKEDALHLGQALADALGGSFVTLDAQNRIARVVFSSSRPNVPFTNIYLDLATIRDNIEKDLARRDFTIDAIAVELNDFLTHEIKADLIDPFQGLPDLRLGSIRALNDQVFLADPARLLRAFRLAAEMKFTIETATLDLIRRDAQKLSQVAGERQREELMRLLSASSAGMMIRKMDECGILTVMIPELEAARAFEQPKEHHWDVLNHSMETVRTAGCILRKELCPYITMEILNHVPWSNKLAEYFETQIAFNITHAAALKLAALLHDIGKPVTRTLENERIRFFGHTEEGANQVEKILERLRFSHREIKLVTQMVRQHMRPTQMSNQGMPTRRAVYRYFRDCGEVAIDILYLSLADHMAARGPQIDNEQWCWHVEQVNYVLSQYDKNNAAIHPPRLIDGHDLINELGMTPGPQMRQILEAVREAQAAGELVNRDEALSYIKNRLIYKKQN